jgi:hypothetical protein
MLKLLKSGRTKTHGFILSWDDDLPGFFTDGIECPEVKDHSVEDFEGKRNPSGIT